MEPAYLVSKGFPWDVAHSLDPVKRLAYCITLGQNDGGEWDWATMTWRPQR